MPKRCGRAMIGCAGDSGTAFRRDWLDTRSPVSRTAKELLDAHDGRLFAEDLSRQVGEDSRGWKVLSTQDVPAPAWLFCPRGREQSRLAEPWAGDRPW